MFSSTFFIISSLSPPTASSTRTSCLLSLPPDSLSAPLILALLDRMTTHELHSCVDNTSSTSSQSPWLLRRNYPYAHLLLATEESYSSSPLSLLPFPHSLFLHEEKTQTALLRFLLPHEWLHAEARQRHSAEEEEGGETEEELHREL